MVPFKVIGFIRLIVIGNNIPFTGNRIRFFQCGHQKFALHLNFFFKMDLSFVFKKVRGGITQSQSLQ